MVRADREIDRPFFILNTLHRLIVEACLGSGHGQCRSLPAAESKTRRNGRMGRKGPIPRSVKERFESKYIAVTETGCWIWIAGTNKHGYGRIQNGGSKLAHRVSWEIHCGPVPEGFSVLHHCDTPPCVNPHHLFLGKDLDNVRDCMKKGRHAHGEKNGSSKLTEAQVMEIIEDGRTLARIAESHGVDIITVYDIKARKTWKHIGRENEIRHQQANSGNLR